MRVLAVRSLLSCLAILPLGMQGCSKLLEVQIFNNSGIEMGVILTDGTKLIGNLGSEKFLYPTMEHGWKM